MANLKIAKNSKHEFKVILRIMQKMFKQIGVKKDEMIESLQMQLKEKENCNPL